MRVLILSGSPRRGSVARELAEHALAYAERRYPEHELDFLSLADEPLEPFRGHEEEYGAETQELVARVGEADALVIAAPVYNGGYASALKNLFEHIHFKTLENRVAGYIIVAGSERGFLAVRGQLDQLMAYFHAVTVPRAVYATREQVEEGIPQETAQRIENLVDQAIALKLSMDSVQEMRGIPSRASPASYAGF